MPTGVPIFIGLLIGTVVLIGALNFFPALALGPIAEALTWRALLMASSTPACSTGRSPGERSSRRCASSIRASCCATP